MATKKRNRCCVDHLGNHYSTMSELCEFYGISDCTFYIRKREGWSLEECLLGKPKEKHIRDHKGNLYATKTEMCEAYGTTLKAFNANQGRGWSLEDSLCGKGKIHRKPSQPRQRQIQKNHIEDHLGRIYTSERQLCRTYCVAHTTYRNRRDQGYSVPEILGVMPLVNAQTKNLTVDTNMVIVCAITEQNSHDIMADWYECKMNGRNVILHHNDIVDYYLKHIINVC